jgi:ABC-type multidrug transport system ATPase subunit
MKTCPQCGTEFPAETASCPRCAAAGKGSVPPGLEAPPVRTTKWEGPPPGSAPAKIPVDVFTSRDGQPHRTARVSDLFAYKSQLLLGRTAPNDICLPHPSVSREHALLEKTPQGLLIRDRGSVNGVQVGGKRISSPILLKEKERFGIGPYLFCLAEGEIHALDSSQSLRLQARGLEKVIDLPGGKTRNLLTNINLTVEPGEFVSLLGPSGSGKSTLMDCLNGRRPATGGRLLANGEDFYRHFASFRQLLGYVPQRDIVHAPLTVHTALYYTARLRLPTDTEPAELNDRIEEVLRLMELVPHRDTLIANLSGGQVKRVSLGAELLARPCLLYIDEATSGLDVGTETRIMKLFRSLTTQGTSVICITHNVDNIALCDLVLILVAGRLAYYGPPAASLPYFGVQRIGDIYDALAQQGPERWEEKFAQSSLHRDYVESRQAAPPGSLLEPKAAAPITLSSPLAPEAVKTVRPANLFWHQFKLLTARYAKLIVGDRKGLELWLLQAPLVAGIVLLAFLNAAFQETVPTFRKLTLVERTALETWINKPADAPLPLPAMLPAPDLVAARRQAQAILAGGMVPSGTMVNPRSTYQLLLLLVIITLWLGCNNASKEIVKEEVIYARERAVNLEIWPYLGSKFVMLGAMTVVQALVMMLLIYGGLEISHLLRGSGWPDPDYCLDLVPQFIVLSLVGLAGVALGLLLSACVNTPDQANTLLPYILIPQIILAGGLIPIKTEPLHGLAVLLSPAYWGWRAVRLGETQLPEMTPGAMDYHDSVPMACMALACQIVVPLLLTAWLLWRKDRNKG